MRPFRDFSIRTKLTLLLAAVIGVALLLSSIALVINGLRMIQSSMAETVTAQADLLGDNCTAALDFGVPETAVQVLNSLRLQSMIVFARVYDAEGNEFASYTAPGANSIAPPERRAGNAPFVEEGYLHVFRPIVQDQVIGTVYLQASQDEIRAQFRRYALIVVLVLSGSLVASVLLASFLQSVITRPILRLVDAAQRVTAESDFSTRVENEGHDELGILCNAFNVMLAQIEQRDAELEQHRLHLAELVQERTRNLEVKTEELARSNIELERKNEELQQFAVISSHDLQEPLRKIQAFGNMLQKKYQQSLGEQGGDYLRRMQDAATRMRALIDGLLTYIRIDRQVQPFVEVDLADVAEAAVSHHKAPLQQVDAQVNIGELPKIEAHPTQMRQLLSNLLDNAVKFRRPDTPLVISVQGRLMTNGEGAYLNAAGSREVCQITVEDNGIGFDEKYLDRIFLPYARLHGRDRYEGTGMGLAVCRKIAECHGGTITANAAPDQGATFTVTLPARQAQGEKAT